MAPLLESSPEGEIWRVFGPEALAAKVNRSNETSVEDIKTNERSADDLLKLYHLYLKNHFK